MLDQARLFANLRQFSDVGYGSFRGFPNTIVRAREEWSAAFADYFSQVQEGITPPVPGHPALALTGVKDAFFAQIALEPTVSAALAAADFADAWQSGVGAVTPGSPVVDASSNSYVFIQFVNVPALGEALRVSLAALFSAPSASALDRLAEIAQAFHTASSALSLSVTITNAAGSAPGTIGVL